MAQHEHFLSLVVPAFNEANRFEPPLLHAIQYLESNFVQWEIIYVDDGSVDATYDKLMAISSGQPRLRVLRHDKNYGKGRAVRTGFQAATGELVLFSDADFSTPIEEITKLLNQITDGFDIAIGSRGLAESNIEVHQPWIRETMGRGGNLLIRAMLNLPIYDTQCGFKLLRRPVIESILPKMRVDGFAFDIEMLAVALLQGYQIKEVPITWRNILESKVGVIHSLRVLRDLFQIRYRLAMNEYS